MVVWPQVLRVEEVRSSRPCRVELEKNVLSRRANRPSIESSSTLLPEGETRFPKGEREREREREELGRRFSVSIQGEGGGFERDSKRERVFIATENFRLLQICVFLGTSSPNVVQMTFDFAVFLYSNAGTKRRQGRRKRLDRHKIQ